MSGEGRARAIVSVRAESRIEVWTIVARDVDVAKAHREIDRLSRQYSFHRFFVVDDMLVASMVLFADPFVPAQLHAALQGTLYVSGQLRGLRKKLEKPRSQRRRANATPDIDPRLMSLFVSGRRMQTAELVETAVSLAEGSEATLQAWRERSIAAHARRRACSATHGDVQRRPPPVGELVAPGDPGTRPGPRRGRSGLEGDVVSTTTIRDAVWSSFSASLALVLRETPQDEFFVLELECDDDSGAGRVRPVLCLRARHDPVRGREQRVPRRRAAGTPSKTCGGWPSRAGANRVTSTDRARRTTTSTSTSSGPSSPPTRSSGCSATCGASRGPRDAHRPFDSHSDCI